MENQVDDKAYKELVQATADTLARHNGNIRATAKELGISRSSVRRRLAKTGKLKKPLAAGTTHGFGKTEVRELPAEGEIKRYILTSAQNNTRIHKGLWKNLLALANYYGAEIIVGTFTYNQNNFGPLAVKAGTHKGYQKQLWYDPAVTSYIRDHRIQLANGLMWCGEYNALPTNVNPLAGLENYTGRKSSIFPHAKLAMRSIPTFTASQGVKLNFTTGTVTKKNYIQKREGVIAEFHHIYGALLVEVNSEGRWWVRQLNQDEDTRSVQDLQVLAQGGKIVTTEAPVEAIVHGDLHGTMANAGAVSAALNMLDVLKPKYQFLHDVLEGASINRHVVKNGAKNNPHYAFDRWLRGLHRVDEEFRRTAELIKKFLRPGTKSYAPDANHDAWWLHSWLERYEYKVDPANSEFFLDLQKHMYDELRKGADAGYRVMPRDVNMMQYAFAKFGIEENDLDFLLDDESKRICDNKIECAMHGHLGTNGAYASPEQLSKMGVRANTAHTHVAGIWNGLYVAGTLSDFKWTYNHGPSSWTHSSILTYPNGKRTIITMFDGRWRA
jgi:hypothetical protein